MARILCAVINYNYGRYLTECLASIDAQIGQNTLRVMVVDDCSTDGSQEIIREWSKQTRLEVETTFKDVNCGPADSYNQVIRAIRPDDDFLAIIDSDDYWSPQKFQAQVEAFSNAPTGTVVVYSDVDVLDDLSGVIESNSTVVLPEGKPPIEQLLSTTVFTPLNSALVRTDAVSQIDSTLRLCDLQLWLGVARHGSFMYSPGVVGVVRRHGGSMTRSETLIEDRLKILSNHVLGRSERAWARRRGRKLLKTSMVQRSRLSMRVSLQYALATHDSVALAWISLVWLPGGGAIARAIYHHRRRSSSNV